MSSRDLRRERRIREAVLGAQLAAARAVAGLFEPMLLADKSLNLAWNPDAPLPWKQATTRTRAALILTQGAMAADRAQRQGPVTQVFGMVYMQPRVEAHEEWERMAAATGGAAKVIEAVVTPERKDP